MAGKTGEKAKTKEHIVDTRTKHEFDELLQFLINYFFSRKLK